MADTDKETELAHTHLQIHAWSAKLKDGVRLDPAEITNLITMAHRGADPTPAAPVDLRGRLSAATIAELERVSIEIEPGVRQIWIKGETVHG